MKALLLIPLLLLAGCNTSKPEGVLIGTLSVYKTNKGVMVVSDQSGERMIVNFHIQRVLIVK